MRNVKEHYGKLNDPDDTFDIDFWQEQGPEAIFQAAYDMLMDVQLMKEGHTRELRLDKTVARYGKLRFEGDGDATDDPPPGWKEIRHENTPQDHRD